MMWVHFIISPLLIYFSKGDLIPQEFSRNYFGDSDIHHIVVFACWSETDALNFARGVMDLDTGVSYNPITPDLNLGLILRVNYYHIGVFLDYDCPSSKIILDQFSEKLVFNESYSWLLYTESSILPTDTLRHLPLTVESELTVATRDGDTIELFDVYNPSYRHGGSLNVTYKGHWTVSSGLKNELTQYKYVRRGNFNLLTLNFSAVVPNPPPLSELHTYLSVPDNPHLDSMTRSHYALVLQLKDLYNFTMNLKLDNSWGYLVNGSFTGICGDLARKTVDISVTPFQYIESRLVALEHTVETWTVRTCFFFRHPRGNFLKNNFLKPFEVELWWAISIVATIYWILLLVSLKCEIKWNAGTSTGSLVTTPASETGLITLAALSQQGLSDGPRILSGRIVFLSLFIWALLLFQFYSASIVSALLAAPPRWILTMDNLTDSDLECALEDVAYHHDYYANTNNPVSRRFMTAKIKPTKKRPKGGFMTSEEGFRKVQEGGFAFDIDTAPGYKIITDTFKEEEICELQEIEMLNPRKVTIATSKKSPFKKMVIYGLQKIVESGLTRRLRTIWHYKRPQCPEGYSSKPSPVPMKQFSPAIFLLLIGIGVSLSIMAIEYLYFHWFDDNVVPIDQIHAIPDDFQTKDAEDVPDYEVNSDKDGSA